jgi:hypothetical protein
MFYWTIFKGPPTWDKISYSTMHIADVDKNITKISDEYRLLDEFIHSANICETRMGKWHTKPRTAFEGLSEIFDFCAK